MSRKGFPESYDVRRLLQFLAELKAGEPEVRAPVYSHLTYDIVHGEEIVLRSPDIVIVEGVNVLQTPARRGRRRSRASSSPTSSTSRSTSTRAEADLERWYVDRLAVAARDVAARPAFVLQLPHAVHRGRHARVRRTIWHEVNLVNLRENIAPTRGRAHLVLEKGGDHGCSACGCESCEPVPRPRHAAQAEPRELGDPPRRGLGVARRRRCPDRRACAGPTDSAMPTSALASIARCCVGRRDLDQRRRWCRPRPCDDLVDDACELGIGADRRAEQQPERRPGCRPRTGSTRGSRVSTRSRPDARRCAWPRRACSSSWRPVSSSSSTYSARLLGKCWYSTGLVTPAASAISSIDVAWKPCCGEHGRARRRGAAGGVGRRAVASDRQGVPAVRVQTLDFSGIT